MPEIQKVSIALTGEQVTALKAAVEPESTPPPARPSARRCASGSGSRDLRGEELKRLRQSWQEGKASGRRLRSTLPRRARRRAAAKKAKDRPHEANTTVDAAGQRGLAGDLRHHRIGQPSAAERGVLGDGSEGDAAGRHATARSASPGDRACGEGCWSRASTCCSMRRTRTATMGLWMRSRSCAWFTGIET